jgi:D-lactate dehydrogenase
VTELVDLVVGKHDGSLQAEHGTGRNMAPFVASECGEKATAMMWRIKQLADPDGLLAPDVILTRNPDVHLENLKSFPQIEGVAGASHCIECGFCEPVCPSRNVTMTPRQRIALRREMARQKSDSAMLAQLQREYQFDGIETCAGDGTCAIPCPIGINTGALIKEFSVRENSPAAEAMALRLARHWKAVERLARVSLRGVHAFSSVFGVKPLTVLPLSREVLSVRTSCPRWPGLCHESLPAYPKLTGTVPQRSISVRASTACSAAIPAAPSLAETLVALSGRAGKPLWIPPDVAGLCCSTPWGSEGYQQGHKYMAKAVADAQWRWSDGGALPIVVDSASCSLGLRERISRRSSKESKKSSTRASGLSTR